MRNYRLLTYLIAPFIPLWLYWRRLKGKEDAARLKERYGIASLKRPKGVLMWLHAASIGEANSVLPLMAKICESFPHVSLLLTTGTVTSAKLMQSRLPAGVMHQYMPVDTPQATLRFMRYWKPELAFFVESELWPNLVMAADYYECFTGIINGRMSERSMQHWQKHPEMITTLLRCFNTLFAQSEEDARRFQALGARGIMQVGNLKYDAALLPCDEAELVRVKNAIGFRRIWLAASTHQGEEAMIATAHNAIAAKYPNLLTIIVPRHPNRGVNIAQEFKKNYREVALRSLGEPVSDTTQIYVADTLGELGLFYRLSEIVFMGGSLIKHGGQNPLEAARLACAVITGPYTHNFADIYREMEKLGIVRRVADTGDLAAQVIQLFTNPKSLSEMQSGAKQWMAQQGGGVTRLLELLAPLFEVKR